MGQQMTEKETKELLLQYQELFQSLLEISLAFLITQPEDEEIAKGFGIEDPLWWSEDYKKNLNKEKAIKAILSLRPGYLRPNPHFAINSLEKVPYPTLKMAQLYRLADRFVDDLLKGIYPDYLEVESFDDKANYILNVINSYEKDMSFTKKELLYLLEQRNYYSKIGYACSKYVLQKSKENK